MVSWLVRSWSVVEVAVDLRLCAVTELCWYSRMGREISDRTGTLMVDQVMLLAVAIRLESGHHCPNISINIGKLPLEASHIPLQKTHLAV
jgi:hypothetical protein